MNKQIQELAVQASKQAFPTGSMAWMEVFAELIVRECVLISRTSTDGFNAGRRMEEHFGVE
jgi:hypothetical protein